MCFLTHSGQVLQLSDKLTVTLNSAVAGMQAGKLWKIWIQKSESCAYVQGQQSHPSGSLPTHPGSLGPGDGHPHQRRSRRRAGICHKTGCNRPYPPAQCPALHHPFEVLPRLHFSFQVTFACIAFNSVPGRKCVCLYSCKTSLYCCEVSAVSASLCMSLCICRGLVSLQARQGGSGGSRGNPTSSATPGRKATSTPARHLSFQQASPAEQRQPVTSGVCCLLGLSKI